MCELLCECRETDQDEVREKNKNHAECKVDVDSTRWPVGECKRTDQCDLKQSIQCTHSVYIQTVYTQCVHTHSVHTV